MNIIVFGLEARRATQNWHKPHLIEIGVLKISSVNGRLKIVDEFHEYVVAPKKENSIDEEVVDELFSEMLPSIPSLKDDTENLIEWIGESDYYLFTWTIDTIRLFLLNTTYQENIPYKWLKNYSIIKNSIEGRPNKKPLSEFSKQQKFKDLNKTKMMRKLYAVTELAIENLDFLSFNKNKTEDILALFSNDLHKTCSRCKTKKEKKHFSVKSVCNNCRNQRTLERRIKKMAESG